MNHLLPKHIVTFALVLIAFDSRMVAQDSSKGEASGAAVKQFLQQVLRTNDKNGDGKITDDEAIRQLKKNFDNVDTDGDGEITTAELTVLAKRLAGRQRNPKVDSPARQKTVVPDNVILETDITYREGNKKWRLDLARPKAATSTPRPAIVMIHGGGWRSGDKGGGLWRSLPFEYAAQGYVCISVNYRLTDEATVLDCIADCKCAVRWLRAHAEKYNVDPDRIGAYGNSAGAHLVSVLGLASAKARLEGDGPFQDQSSLVQAVCCSAPPSDFMNWGKKKNGNANTALSRLFGDLDADDAKKSASPVSHATDKAPPFLIIHGTGDTTVPVAQGDALERALVEAGAKDVTYMKIKGAGHGVFMQHAKKTRPAMKEFFDRVFRSDK